MSRLTRDGTAEPVSRGQILRRERGQGNIHFPCLADYEQDWQPYSVDPYSCYMCDHTYMHIWCETLQPRSSGMLIMSAEQRCCYNSTVDATDSSIVKSIAVSMKRLASVRSVAAAVAIEEPPPQVRGAMIQRPDHG